MVIGSDSGRIVILEYIPAKNTFEKVTYTVVLATGIAAPTVYIYTHEMCILKYYNSFYTV